MHHEMGFLHRILQTADLTRNSAVSFRSKEGDTAVLDSDVTAEIRVQNMLHAQEMQTPLSPFVTLVTAAEMSNFGHIDFATCYPACPSEHQSTSASTA